MQRIVYIEEGWILEKRVEYIILEHHCAIERDEKRAEKRSTSSFIKSLK
jgi:hypothetical protein